MGLCAASSTSTLTAHATTAGSGSSSFSHGNVEKMTRYYKRSYEYNFTLAALRGWYQAGYLPPNHRVRRAYEPDFSQLHTFSEITAAHASPVRDFCTHRAAVPFIYCKH